MTMRGKRALRKNRFTAIFEEGSSLLLLAELSGTAIPPTDSA